MSGFSRGDEGIRQFIEDACLHGERLNSCQDAGHICQAGPRAAGSVAAAAGARPSGSGRGSSCEGMLLSLRHP